MKRLLLILPVLCAACQGCFHIDTTKINRVYFPEDASPATRTAQAAPLGLTTTAGAATPAAVTSSAGDNTAGKKQKIKPRNILINSDTMTFDKETSEAVFSGSVTASAADVKIYSDKLVSTNYREEALATGNVRAVYDKYGVKISCGRLKYMGGMNNVKAFDGVVAKKSLPNGNTVTMYCEELDFNAADSTMEAKKSDKRVRVVMKDIVAFSDEVSYNDKNRELYFSGRPVIKKSKSLFLSDYIWLNTDDKSIRMKDNIWTRFFYRDFQKTSAEVQLEADKNAASGKALQ
jgi:lipopolysaccharide assembly outer membrane protein LptD (OstA)